MTAHRPNSPKVRIGGVKTTAWIVMSPHMKLGSILRRTNMTVLGLPKCPLAFLAGGNRNSCIPTQCLSPIQFKSQIRPQPYSLDIKPEL